MTPHPQQLAPAPGTRARRAGFTLLELLVVLAVVATLMGVGVGFLQRGATDLDAALLTVGDQIRVAATTARARSLPTEVQATGGRDGAPVRIHVRGLRHVGSWHFEEGERPFDRRLTPQLSGHAEPGRFGQARRHDLDSGAALLTVHNREGALALGTGFAVRVDVRPDSYGAAIVVRYGRAFTLSLDPDLVPQAAVTLAGTADNPGTTVQLTARWPLRLSQWAALELNHDGREVSLLVDGQLVAREVAGGRPFDRSGAVLEVSPGTDAFDGLVDEVQLLAYEDGDLQLLPVGVEVQPAPPWRLAFGRDGALVEPQEFAFSLVMPMGDDELTERRRVAPGGVLQPVFAAGAKEMP